MLNSNLVNLSKWAQRSSISKEENTLSRYYSLLSFSELISESMTIVTEIDSTNNEAEIILRSKVLIQEFRKRTKSQNFQMAQIMKQMVLNIEVNLATLKEIC